MIPIIELKGAIPIGVSYGENLLTSALLGYAGSSLISIPLFFLLIPIFNLLKKIQFIKKLVEKMSCVQFNIRNSFNWVSYPTYVIILCLT